jgi:predicted ATPase/tetratricopeptide (TPR) repeat protein
MMRAFHSDKARALLAYLALESRRQPVRRDRLAALLWEGYLHESALQSLRTALFDLRQLLAPANLLVASRQDVWLQTAAPGFWCDALEVERIWADLTAGRGDSPARAQQFETLAGLLQGEFMAGFALPDAPAFTAWLDAQRQRYAELAGRVAAAGAPAVRHTPHNLPRPATPFFGREQELAALREKLLDPAYPLLTLTGLGGAGKTRLALAAAESVLDFFPDGVWFVPLAGIALPADASVSPAEAAKSLDHLASAVVAALRLDAACCAPPVQQLLAYVGPRRLLLVLDNFEHLAPGRELLIRLAHEAPRLKLLVTSRQRLGLQMEQVIPVGGLPAPTRPPAFDASAGRFAIAQDAAGLRLFVERAGRTAAGFALTPANVADVLAICRAVAGLPLAIELAAALTDRYSCAEILGALRRGISALAGPAPDREARHHSMSAVFEYSWSLLSPRLAAVLADCTVFCNGFTAEAAAVVMGATPDDLKALLDSSHLSRSETGRYQMHELLRQFAGEKLDARRAQTIRDNHARYYLRPFREQPTATYWHTCPDERMNALSQDLANIREAGLWILRMELWGPLNQAINGLCFFVDRKGLAAPALAILEHMCEVLAASDLKPTFVQRNLFWSRLHGWRAYFLIQVGQHELAATEARLALQAAHNAQDAPSVAGALLSLGRALLYLGDYQRADEFWRQGLEVCREPAAASLQVQFLSNLGQISFRLGELDAAQRYLTDAIRSAQAAGDPVDEAGVRLNLGMCYLIAGAYGAAWAQLAAPATRTLVAGHALLAADLDNRLGLLYLSLGDFAAAEVTLRRVAEHAVKLKYEELHIFELTSRTRLNYALGDYDATLAAVEAALPICRAYKPPYPLATVQTFAGHAHLALGELDQAEAMYEAALRVWQSHAYLTRRAERLAAVAGLAEVALARNDLARAAAIVAEVATELGPPYTFQPAHNEPLRIFLTCHRTWAAVGDPRAAEILAAAAAILQAQAAGIPDAALRRHFLQDVAVNREIRRLAASALSG